MRNDITLTEREMFAEMWDLLFQRFRCALLEKTRDDRIDDPPSEMAWDVTETCLMGPMKEPILDIVDRYALEEAPSVDTPIVQRRGDFARSGTVKTLVHRIALEAWEARYNGPIEVHMKVRSSTITLHNIRHPNHA
jgi:hypothetical protein